MEQNAFPISRHKEEGMGVVKGFSALKSSVANVDL
jgi:hypothetical protein